jgi:hypothetical protein
MFSKQPAECSIGLRDQLHHRQDGVTVVPFGSLGA